MKKAFVTLLACLSLTFSSSLSAKDKKLVDAVKSSVGILYSQTSTGSMTMHCTVTAFQKITETDLDTKVTKPVAYRFLTAAHCVGDDIVSKEKSADTSRDTYFITFDESGKEPKKFWPAKPIFVGYQSRGEDFAEFEVESNESWTIVPLGDERKASDGDDIVNVSVPLGLGKQLLYGTISKVFLDRPVQQDTINWKGAIMLQLPGINGGSSGSAIVSEDQKSIVGILVGTIGGNTIVAVPVSRFIAVRKAVGERKYKYFQPTVEVNPDGSPAQ